MDSNERATMNALKEKNEELERILKKVLGNAVVVGTVVDGPMIKDNVYYYRIDAGGNERIVISANKEKYKKGEEIIIGEAGNMIAKSVPKELTAQKTLERFQSIGWEEIGGLKSQIEEIRKQVEGPMKRAQYYKEFGITPSKGILLYGPPGCGKTLIGKVIASVIINGGSKDSFIYIKGPELLASYVGQTERHVRTVFNKCRVHSKETGERSVVFIDEAEALLPRRGSGISSDVQNTIVPQFLSEMDGFDDSSPFVLLSTNFPQAIDPAILREGRIDLKIEIKRPTKDDAVDIFKIHLKKVKLVDNIDLLANKGTEFLYSTGIAVSGSMIQVIVNMAAQEALYRYLRTSTQKGIIVEDIFHSVNKITESQIN